MTQELREAILSAWGAPEHDDIMPKRADAAIALVLEEAAKVADAMFWEHTNGKFDSFNNDPSWNAGDHGAYIASTISAAIRALKENSDA